MTDIDDIYDEIIELESENKTLKKDNESLESKILSNKQNIIEAEQKLEQIMKDLINTGGFKIDETSELIMLIELINNSDNKFNKNKMTKCVELLINFANQYLDIYQKANEVNDKEEESYDEKLSELLLMSKDDLVDMCKDKDLSYSGSKKKLAERLLENE